MYKTVLFALLLATTWGAAQTTPPATNSAGRTLILENSTMSLPTAKATLIIGPLICSNHVYVGEFKVKVFPYFFKNQRGLLAINVPEEAQAAFNQGKPVTVSGTATSTKDGHVRQVQIMATPKDSDHGTVSLWFNAANQKMIFNPAYYFTNDAPTTATAPPPSKRR
ncbi:MAG: hypothetical protein WCK57_07460 [Verrucomicrobiae bacterium]